MWSILALLKLKHVVVFVSCFTMNIPVVWVILCLLCALVFLFWVSYLVIRSITSSLELGFYCVLSFNSFLFKSLRFLLFQFLWNFVSVLRNYCGFLFWLKKSEKLTYLYSDFVGIQLKKNVQKQKRKKVINSKSRDVFSPKKTILVWCCSRYKIYYTLLLGFLTSNFYHTLLDVLWSWNKILRFKFVIIFPQ